MRPKRVVVWAVVDMYGCVFAFETRAKAREHARQWDDMIPNDAPNTIVRCEGTFTKPKGRKK